MFFSTVHKKPNADGCHRRRRETESAIASWIATPQPLHRQAGGVSVWHPENLDVDALLESCGRRVAEGVLWLGHCVYTGLADDARCRDTGRVPLRADYLRNVVGRHHVDAVRQAALQAGYVDRDRVLSRRAPLASLLDSAALRSRPAGPAADHRPRIAPQHPHVARSASPGDVAANPAQRNAGRCRGLRAPLAESSERPDRRARSTSATPSTRRTRLP